MQPLLRGFKTDSTRQQLQVTKLNRDVSDVQLTSTITNTLSNVRNAYWDYVFAVQSVEVARQSLDLANKLVEDNQTRVQIGTMAPIDVVQAQAQAATAVQNLVAAQATQRTAELALKRLIVNGTQDPNWNATIDPVDRPDFRPETDRHRGGDPARAEPAHRPDDRPEERPGQRRHAEVPRRPDEAAGRPQGDLRVVRRRRHAARANGHGHRRRRAHH